MFGTYRTLLAICVVVQHLVQIPIIGHYAVFSFFLLSGYLMTFVMQERYGYNKTGRIKFLINRALRLYPSYWLILFLTIIVILFFGAAATSEYRKFIYLPESITSWFENISLIYFNLHPPSSTPRLSPATWALTVEILYYFLICLGVSKTKNRTLTWLSFSVVYTFTIIILNFHESYLYSHILAGSLPFSLGAVLYYYKDSTKSGCRTLLRPNLLFGVYFLNSFLFMLGAWRDYSFFNNQLLGFYISLGLTFFLLASLIDKKLYFLSPSLDKKIGDLSYPIYLSHWLVGFIISMILFKEPLRGFNQEGWIICVLTIIVSVLLAYMINITIDRRVERIRTRFK